MWATPAAPLAAQGVGELKIQQIDVQHFSSLSFKNDGRLGTLFRYICDNGTYIAHRLEMSLA